MQREQSRPQADGDRQLAMRMGGVVELHGNHMGPEGLRDQIQERVPVGRTQIHAIQGIDQLRTAPTIHFSLSAAYAHLATSSVWMMTG